MSKKKKKSKKEADIFRDRLITLQSQHNDKSKKELDNEFRRVIQDVEDMQITLMETDKMQNRKRKHRKAVNKKETIYYYEMEQIKARQKMAKTWKKTGFLDKLMLMLEYTIPIVRMLARLVCSLITTFLQIDGIRSSISPKMLKKISKVFNFALAI